jgi:hypothetical protein
MRPMGRLIDTQVETVDGLVTNEHLWNEEKVRSIFLAPDADAIMQIPLRRSIEEDWLAWAKEKSGLYTVRSAYRALVLNEEHNVVAQDLNNTSSSDQDESLWRVLWKLRVVPKVRIFWWRVLKGIMPDYSTLTRRHVMEDSTCGICKATSENLMHALIECSHAKLFWNEAKEILNIKLPRLHPNTWAKDLLCEEFIAKEDKPKIITIMYSIWHSKE